MQQITDIRYTDYGVQITFNDGIVAYWEAYAHGFGYNIEGLRRYSLQQNNKTVFDYNARLFQGYDPSNTEENRIKFIAPNWTQQQAAEYWTIARTYLDWAYFKEGELDPKKREKLWWAWRIVCGEGYSDLEKLLEGTAIMVGEVYEWQKKYIV